MQVLDHPVTTVELFQKHNDIGKAGGDEILHQSVLEGIKEHYSSQEQGTYG